MTTERGTPSAREQLDELRRVPRRAEGGASAPPAVWIVDPPRGTPFDKREFASLREAEEYANTCPPRTRIVYPSQQEGTYEHYLASFHGPTAPLSRDEWERKHAFEQSELARKIAHYGAQLDADRAEVRDIIEPAGISKPTLPNTLLSCPKHNVVFVRDGGSCYICQQERPRQDTRVIAHDDSYAVYISTHNAPLTPEHAIRLAATLLESALRILDRRETVARDNTSTPI